MYLWKLINIYIYIYIYIYVTDIYIYILKLVDNTWEQLRTRICQTLDWEIICHNSLFQAKANKKCFQKTLTYILEEVWVIFFFLRKSSAVSFCIYCLPTLCKISAKIMRKFWEKFADRLQNRQIDIRTGGR